MIYNVEYLNIYKDLSKPSNSAAFEDLFENWISFKRFKIKGLNKQDISILFSQRCYYQFHPRNVENHEQIQCVIDGKPGYCMKAAAFYLLKAAEETENPDPQKITLDDIVEKLRGDSGWLREFRV